MIQTFQTILSKKAQLTTNIWLLTFAIQSPESVEFKAGQYMILLVPQPDGSKARRLYSINSPDSEKKTFEMVIEIVPNGIGSTYLDKMQIGEQAYFQGPAGLFTLKESPRNKIFLATGTGIAPINSIIESTLPFMQSIEYYLFWGVQTMKDVYFLNKFKELETNYPNFHFFICTSRETHLEAIDEIDRKNFILGRVTTGFEKICMNESAENIQKPLSDYDFYVCGGKEVVDSLREYLANKNITKETIHFEKFV